METGKIENYWIDSLHAAFAGVQVQYHNETLSRVFDISSQSKLKLRSKRRNKIVKIYAN